MKIRKMKHLKMRHTSWMVEWNHWMWEMDKKDPQPEQQEHPRRVARRSKTWNIRRIYTVVRCKDGQVISKSYDIWEAEDMVNRAYTNKKARLKTLVRSL